MSGVCGSIRQARFRSVREAFMEAGMPYDPDNDSGLLIWNDSIKDQDYFSQLKPWQIVNRIPNMNVICRKVPFGRVTSIMKQLFPQIYSCFPMTYMLPYHNETFMSDREKTNKTYIYKPDMGSMGHGIQIITPESSFHPSTTELAVAQEYYKPYLIDDRKFDLRIYVLVASVDPLEIYIYRDGLARFCSEDYSKGNRQSQLANVAVNRENPDMEISSISRLISEVFPEMASTGIDIDDLWMRIDRVVILSIFAGHKFLSESVNSTCNRRHYSRCFQILGFDVLLDNNCRPHVLEVNYRPILDYYRGKERRMKVSMIRDALLIAAPHAKLQTAAEARKWFKSEQSWDSFIQANPDLLEAARKIKEETIEKGKYDRIWPNSDKRFQNFEKILEGAHKVPLEPLPGFKMPVKEVK